MPNSRFHAPVRGLLAMGLLLASVPGRAEIPGPWSMTAYLQQSWPKQTETNRQIREINTSFGATFKTWDDTPNLNLGLQAFRDLDPHWKVGVGIDYSRGKISGATTVDTLAGPAMLAFEQKYTVYADLLALLQYRPLGSSGRWVPFILAGAGMAYEKDRTSLALHNNLVDESLRVNNSGWLPILTAGMGVDVALSEQRTWFLEVGLSYSWSRLKHSVPASGTLAPSPTVIADTDSTGPNVWVGVGRRF